MTHSKASHGGGRPAASLPLRRLAVAVAVLATALVLSGRAEAVGGDYVFVGGSPAARETVRTALERSRFDWSLVPKQITIRIIDCGCAGANPGEILLDERVLTDARFGLKYAWGIVQHEYAHQVADFLLDLRLRRQVMRWLGGSDWCYELEGVAHDDHGCERFASSLAWAFWPSRYNVMRWETDVQAADFRAKLEQLLSQSHEGRR